MMLGSGSSVAVQDPSYPVYVDSSVIMGMTGEYDHASTSFGNVQYMPCTPDNGFFPDISLVSSQLYQASCSKPLQADSSYIMDWVCVESGRRCCDAQNKITC